MVVIMTDPTSDSQVFIDAWKGEKVDWNRAFAKFNAALDWPSSTFYKQLMELYPDAKVIHTTRNPEKWYESVKNTIMPATTLENRPGMPAHVANGQRMAREVIWEGELGGMFADKEATIQMFKDHDEEVKNYVPADKLLMFETGVDGWEKLCAFLGKEVPNAPWPHVNKTEDFKTNVLRMREGQKIENITAVKSD
jgi:hypothetical protein